MAGLIRRNGIYHLIHYVGSKQRRESLHTDSFQVAKDKKRQFESAQVRDEDSPLPSRTPIADVLTAYAADIRARKPGKSAQTEVYYLREAFGPICDALRVNSRRQTLKTKKRPAAENQDLRRRPVVIEAPSFEQITTVQISSFITGMVENRGLAPKTANHHRQILTTLFNWAMEQHGVRMPGGRNPAQKVKRFRERAPEIEFLTLEQIDQQLDALKFQPQLQTMVAMYIFAGLRREEALWLTAEDIDYTTGRFGMIWVRAKTVNGMKWQPKTSVNRAVPISSTLRTFLDKYTPRPSDGNWFFPSPDGKHWDPDNFSADLHAANKVHGISWACLIYRHTFGSHLAMADVSLYKISKLMGNSPEICRRHYAALLPEDMGDEVEFRKIKPLSRVA